MGNLVDLTGQRFGRLIVIERAGRDMCKRALWRCQCDCGQQCVVSGANLRNENTKSCGCFQREKARECIIDLTGQRFGRLIVIEQAGRDVGGQALWNCQCDCGKQCVVRGMCLRNGNTQSCGCFLKEKTKERSTKHGKSDTLLYQVWHSMMNRCGLRGKPSRLSVKNYVSRGITVCEEWRVFENFERWGLSHGYKHGFQIDRKDNNGCYCPDNCHFVTRTENNRNRRKSWKLPSGEHIYDFCERWVNYPLSNSEYRKVKYCWTFHNHKRLPDFVFIAMRNRAIADLDAAHKRAENGQP